jgi:hypothetical protein
MYTNLPFESDTKKGLPGWLAKKAGFNSTGAVCPLPSKPLPAT